jgi:hypothetical protein
VRTEVQQSGGQIETMLTMGKTAEKLGIGESGARRASLRKVLPCQVIYSRRRGILSDVETYLRTSRCRRPKSQGEAV